MDDMSAYCFKAMRHAPMEGEAWPVEQTATECKMPIMLELEVFATKETIS